MTNDTRWFTSRDYTGIKAGTVVTQGAGQPAPIGVRYIPYEDPGTPATVVERIQRSIGESAEGWRMGFAHIAGKAKEAAAGAQASIQRSVTGLQMGVSQAGSKVSSTVSGVGEWFGNVGKGISSMQWLLYIIVFVLIFVAIMTSIGYSGVGGPAARVAEREHARRR